MTPVTIHNISYQYHSWENLGEDIFTLSKKIIDSSKKFDRIIALAKGGLAFSRSLGDYLNISELSSIQVEFYEGINKTAGLPVVTQSLPVNIRNERILLFDDLVETGKTMELAQLYIGQHGAKEITIATLFMKPQTIIKPDFFVHETTAWIIHPWEIRETLFELRVMWDKKGDSENTIYKQLLHIGLPKQQVDFYLNKSINKP